MNTDLNKYLAHVFRNELGKHSSPDNDPPKESSEVSTSSQTFERFLLDKKYSLRLDEIA